MNIAEEEFLWKLKATDSRLSAFDSAKKVFKERFDFYESGDILLMQEFFPWKSALYEVEREAGQEGSVKFVLYKEQYSNGYRI